MIIVQIFCSNYRKFSFLKITTKLDNKIKSDYIQKNAQSIKNLSKTRKTTSEEKCKQIQEKQDKELKSYQEKINGRIPD